MQTVGLRRSYDGTLVPAWVPKADQNRYWSRKGRLAQNVLAICDFDMNFTYVYAGWEGSAAMPVSSRMQYHKTRLFLSRRLWGMPSYLLNHQVDLVIACCTLHNFIHMAYRRYLESAGFPQEEHWKLNVEQRFMWMIVDENTRAPMRDDARAETQMGH
ncbi:UNVERIFIED_CONTAM: hypothetical protein Sradi_1740700 [Sesamum radiatum]|uniref:DDE Tnp4 domain-containing protein n=1 Tax=Sesamum radiatum TaxID=300843 RepID=A0AAW2TV13_SESRA